VFQLTPGANGKWTERVLHSFNNADGSDPYAGVIFDGAGNLYGTTSELGYGRAGNVFKLALGDNGKWSETVLHSFELTDGQYPFSGVISDATGNLYGTTLQGGNYEGYCSDAGCGVVFKLASAAGGKWSDTTIRAFNERDGEFPTGGVVFDAAGNLYGAAAGGPGKGGVHGGVVFKLTPGADGGWTETLLYSFGKGDVLRGYDPVALIFDRTTGNLYGTAFQGGSGECAAGCGGVFELIPGGDGKWTKKVLYIFHGSDGATPDATLTLDALGNLYGTTVQGGAHNDGTVFKLTPHANGKWTETVLHSFNGKDGSSPYSTLVFDAAGSLYGTTSLGGNFSDCDNRDGCGVVFKITP